MEKTLYEIKITSMEGSFKRTYNHYGTKDEIMHRILMFRNKRLRIHLKKVLDIKSLTKIKFTHENGREYTIEKLGIYQRIG